MLDWGKADKTSVEYTNDNGIYDLLILGAGPAGMTAGVYAARKQLRTVIVSKDIGGQTSWSSGIENYLGYLYITGPELVAKFEEHVRNFNLKMEFGKVVKFAHADTFVANTEDGREFQARAVIVATGKSPKMLNVPGEDEFRGRGVSYCPTCDAPLFSGFNVAVIGGGNSGFDAAIQLIKICPKVYIVEATSSLKADEVFIQRALAADNVEILVNTRVEEIIGNEMVTGVRCENIVTGEKRTLDVQGVFVEIGLSPNTGFLAGLLPLNEWGEIPVDCECRTGIPGLYAAGDVTNVAEKQIIIAAGQGATAALRAYDFLIRSEKRRGSEAARSY